jgi:hypothetical protein
MNSDGRPFVRAIARSVGAQAAERLSLAPKPFRHRARRVDWRTIPANKPSRLLVQTTSAVAAMFITGVAVGAALVMSKPRQIVAWSQQPVPVKIAP